MVFRDPSDVLIHLFPKTIAHAARLALVIFNCVEKLGFCLRQELDDHRGLKRLAISLRTSS
jgi:hypothetical protein